MNDQTPDRPANPAPKPAAKPIPQLADYPHRVAEIIRFGDLDPQGHVNQAVFLTYFESGRVAMFRKIRKTSRVTGWDSARPAPAMPAHRGRTRP